MASRAPFPKSPALTPLLLPPSPHLPKTPDMLSTLYFPPHLILGAILALLAFVGFKIVRPFVHLARSCHFLLSDLARFTLPLLP